jgi:hypothetical protein
LQLISRAGKLINGTISSDYQPATYSIASATLQRAPFAPASQLTTPQPVSYSRHYRLDYRRILRSLG